jgi:putative NADPH-quinone reductase
VNILIVLAHPDPGSFNHAIARTSASALRRLGHAVVFHDLYAERFDPVLWSSAMPRDATVAPEVQRHCDELANADGIVVVHPNWWGQPPAILKGWVDRVVRPGVAYAFQEGDGGEGVPLGLLRARTAVVFNTSNTPVDRERSVFGDPLEAIWKRCVFELCGVEDVRRRMFSVVVTSTPQERNAWLGEVEEIVTASFPARTPFEPAVRLPTRSERAPGAERDPKLRG